jgi:hypothetical protein
MDRFDESAIRLHNQRLIRDAVAVLADLWKVPVTRPEAMTAAMTLVPVPDGLRYTAIDEGRAHLAADLLCIHDSKGVTLKKGLTSNASTPCRVGDEKITLAANLGTVGPNA